MTSELVLTPGTQLTSANSNIASNYVVPTSTDFSSLSGQYAIIRNSRGYYSYPAVTAGTNPSSGDAAYDICPRSWRLPTYTEYISFASTYGTTIQGPSTSLRAFPAEMPSNLGYIGRGGTGGSGQSMYWTSSASASGYAGNFRIDSSIIYYTPDCSKNDGDLVRCLAK